MAPKLLFGPLRCKPMPAKPSIKMSFKVEYHRPELRSELESRKNASSLLFPTAPKTRKPESNTLAAAPLLIWGRTNTGWLPFTDCRVVPLQGAVEHAADPSVPPDAPMPTIFRPLRKVTCFTLKVYGPR